MALTQINFDKDEEKIIMKVREIFKLNKPDAIKKIVQSINGYENNIL